MAIIKIRNAAIDLDAAEIPNLPATKITSGTLDNARISLDAAEIPNLDTAKITTGTLADARLPANALNSNVSVPNQSAFKNIIINGDMTIAQRATSKTGITNDGYYTVDRFSHENGSFGTWTQSQASDAPTGQGFTYSLKMDCTTAQTSPSSSSVLLVGQSIEGFMLQPIKQGTTNAESTTLSFWHKHTKTGTNIVELLDADNANAVSGSYTQSVSDTWEKATITFPANTSGTYDNDKNRSLRIRFIMGAGTDLTSGTLATTWQTSVTNANRYVGQVNNADSTSNNFIITGVQYEVGTSASDFEFLPVDVNLRRCHRYLFTLTSPSGQGRFGSGGFFSTTEADTIVSLPVEMRTTYSMSYSSLSHFRLTSHTAASALSSLALETSRVLNAADLRATASTAIGTAGNYALLYTNGSSSKMFFDSEL